MKTVKYLICGALFFVLLGLFTTCTNKGGAVRVDESVTQNNNDKTEQPRDQERVDPDMDTPSVWDEESSSIRPQTTEEELEGGVGRTSGDSSKEFDDSYPIDTTTDESMLGEDDYYYDSTIDVPYEIIDSAEEDIVYRDVENLNIPQAGEHNDNEEFQYFQRFLETYFYAGSYTGGAQIMQKIVSRVVVAVYDQNNNPIMQAKVKFGNETEYTYQDGEAFFYPTSMNRSKSIRIEYNGLVTNLEVSPEKYSRFIVNLNTDRVDIESIPVDIVFLMDTTASMGEEIEMLTDTLYSIYMRVHQIEAGAEVDVRMGMVLYRDTYDTYLTDTFELTDDINEFAEYLFTVEASGGGDTPEDLLTGFDETLDMEWREEAVKIVFVVTDAPAHLNDYKNLSDLCEEAAEKQIKVFSIGAGGLDTTGEIQLRMMSMLTKGNFIFLTYGETDDSAGTGDPDDVGRVSHHTGGNFVSRDLDDVVVDNVEKEIIYQASQDVIALLNEEYDYTEYEEAVYRRVDNALSQIIEQVADSITEESTVLILPPVVDNDSLDEMSMYVSTLSEEIILENNFMKVVTRDNLDEILDEMELKLIGLTDGEDLTYLTEADTILAGKLYFVGDTSVLFVRLINAGTSEVMGAAMVKI